MRRIMALAMILLALALVPLSTWGNGVPVQLFLNYLPDVSNWGPETASGTAIVATGEGYVTLKVQGLPHLNDARYQIWLIPREGEPVAVGKFNVEASGSADFKTTGLKLPATVYKLLVITVEPEPDTSPQPDARRSLVGRFPDPALKTVTAGSVPGSASSAPGQPLPLNLPRTLPVTGGQ
ncbi:MAG: hypothetical protein A2Z04_07365 [Chloroflexi bacterium RBG_16_57_9]|nr:MAG: hypothetical protein A2Z04_07365 [Chloroflexi bacterium RBG_16_57_9]